MSLANHHLCIPQPPLSAFVESFWLYEGERPAHTKERRLPDGSVGLVFNLDDDLICIYDSRDQEAFHSYRGAVLSGPQSGYILLDTASLTTTLGVTFRPTGLMPFLPFPVSDLSDQVLSLETLWGAEVADLRGQLRLAAAPAARFAILECFLLRRLDLSRTGHPAVSSAVAGLQDAARFPTIASLAEHLGLSQTRLVQVFRDAMGMTPKQYARLSRFQRVLARLDAGEAGEWADTVFFCGYFDQSHLIHEFQAFAGLTPGQYLAMRSDFRNHVPLPA
jgi:AraC-like DNA-binding protein